MHMMFRAFFLVSALLLAIPALGEEAKPANKKSAAKPEAPLRDFTIVRMGAEEIKNSDVLDIWKGLFPGGAAPDFNTFDENIRQNVLRGIISEKLIYQEAVKSGYDKSAEVAKRLEMLKKQVVMQSFMEDKAKTLVTDDRLKTAYNEKSAAMKGEEEVKARHILVEKEEDAKKLADELKKGADFNKLAQEKSTDKASGANGGDLGWFTKDRMVPEFAEAAFKLKPGEVSAPVKTAFGWHVIKLEDRRAVKMPSFEEMKETLKSDVTNQAVQAYVEGLLKQANIKYFGPDGKEKEFSLMPKPPEAAPAAGKQ